MDNTGRLQLDVSPFFFVSQLTTTRIYHRYVYGGVSGRQIVFQFMLGPLNSIRCISLLTETAEPGATEAHVVLERLFPKSSASKQ